MLLAEALFKKAVLKKELETLEQRMGESARVPHDEEPIDDYLVLLGSYLEKEGELLDMNLRIQTTNISTAFREGETISQAINRRDSLKRIVSMYNKLLSAATGGGSRGIFSSRDVKYKRVVDMDKTRADMSNAAMQYRELDVKLQQLNWNTELL
ncbi:MAG: DIP1984 family protein [Oscillospiraceae bacterium]|nr:DIP1984 family protein [Oscillospiraceae bacterium]